MVDKKICLIIRKYVFEERLRWEFKQGKKQQYSRKQGNTHKTNTLEIKTKNSSSPAYFFSLFRRLVSSVLFFIISCMNFNTRKSMYAFLLTINTKPSKTLQKLFSGIDKVVNFCSFKSHSLNVIKLISTAKNCQLNAQLVSGVLHPSLFYFPAF